MITGAARLGAVCALGVVVGWGGVASAEEGSAPRIVIVTSGGGQTQTLSSRGSAQPTAVAGASAARPTLPALADPSIVRPAPAALTEPSAARQLPATAATLSGYAELVGQMLTREQVGGLIRSAANNIPPETLGCMVESLATGAETGLTSRDLGALRANDMRWLAERCGLTMAQLAPVAADFVAASMGSAPSGSPPLARLASAQQRVGEMRAGGAGTELAQAMTAPAPLEPLPSTQQRLNEMRVAGASERRTDAPLIGTGTLLLLVASIGGALAAGIGLGQVIGRARAPRAIPVRSGYHVSVARPSSVGQSPRPMPRHGAPRPALCRQERRALIAPRSVQLR